MANMEFSVVFRGLDHSDAVEKRIRGEMDKLARLIGSPLSGTATVESLHRPQGRPQGFSVHLRILADGLDDVIVSQNSDNHDDVHKAVRDTFLVAKRQVKDKVERMRGLGRQHDASAVGPDFS